MSIDIKFAGICHSDIHTGRNEWGEANFPLVPGHEIAGIVAAVGSDVTTHAVGDRVGVGCLIDSCDDCENCRKGEEQFCLGDGSVGTYGSQDYKHGGAWTDGGYSQNIVVRDHFVLRIPDSLSLDAAAPLLCAGITTYSPLRHWGVGPGKNVAVIGLGGLGHMGVKIAHAMGAEVTVLSRSLSKQDDGERLGADHHHATADRATFTKLAGSFDLILNTVSANIPIGDYLGLLKAYGVIVNVGAPAEPMEINAGGLIDGNKVWAGSNIGGIPEDPGDARFLRRARARVGGRGHRRDPDRPGLGPLRRRRRPLPLRHRHVYLQRVTRAGRVPGRVCGPGPCSGRTRSPLSIGRGPGPAGRGRSSSSAAKRRLAPRAQTRGMAKSDVVTVRQLRKTYGSRTVVDGLDLDVREGEILGLAGANGAGKTTTVECVQGLTRPDSGTLRVLGLEPATEAAKLRPLIGSQLQDSALPARLRVAEAVDLFAGPQARPHGAALLEQFGLADRRRAAFASLSGGERQRLFLVLALLNRPRLVILDELTQGLDPAARREVWAAIQQLRRDGTTVLLVTHEMAEAEALCDRIVVLRAGRVLDAGTPAELVGRHASVATVRFSLGDSAAALLTEMGQLTGVRDVRRNGGQVTVEGSRTAIAHVGAALVRYGPVPEDLSVQVPSLDDALLTLLSSTPARELTGGRR